MDKVGTMCLLIAAMLLSAMSILNTPESAEGFRLFLLISPIALVFYLLGYMLKDKMKSWTETSFILEVTTIMLLPLLLVMSNIFPPVTMYLNQYGNPLAFVSMSILGIFAIMVLSQLLRGSKLLKFCGVNSLIIFVWQVYNG